MAPGDRLQLAGAVQLLAPELADRLQHREPRRPAGGLGPADQRLVDQGGEPVEGVHPEVLGIADRLGRLERPAAGEHRQPGEQAPLDRVEQVVAPGDGAAQGPLPVREGPGPGGQQGEALLEPGQDLGGRQHLGPGGGQLDGQGQPVEPGRDLGHRRGVLCRQPELRPRRLGPLHEQRRRLLGAQRRDDQLLLAPEGEGDPGGDQHLDPRGGGEQPLDHGTGPGHLLEVVDDEEELPVAEVVAHGLQHRTPRLGDAEGPGQDRGNQPRVGHRGQIGEERAVAEPGPQLLGDVEGQPGLAGAAGAGEGDQPGPVEEAHDLGGHRLPAHERGELRRQVARPGIERPGGREVRRQPLDHQVVQAHGEVEVPQPVDPEVPQGHPGRDLPLHQDPGGVGDDHLAAGGRPGDPGRPVHVDAAVVVPAQGPLAGVQAHPDPHREPGRPPVAGQAPLGGHRGPDRRHRAGERREEGIAFGADLDPVAVPDRLAQDRRVLVAHRPVAVAQVLQQPGRALDVGEQEGDGPGGQPPRGGPAGRRGRGPRLLRPPAPLQLQAHPEQRGGHAQQRDHAPQDPGGRVERPARPDPFGGGHGHGDEPTEHGGRDHAGVAGQVRLAVVGAPHGPLRYGHHG